MIRKSDFLSRQIFIQITFRRTYVRNPPHNCIAQASIHSPNIDLHLLPTPLIFGAGLGSLQNWYADGVPTDLLGNPGQPNPAQLGSTQPSPTTRTQPRPGTAQPELFFRLFIQQSEWTKTWCALLSTQTHNLSIWRDFHSWKINELSAAF